MCIDYRSVNKLTIKNRYPLPRIDDLLDRLHGAAVYSSIDLPQGYHQQRLCPSDVPKTAFLTHQGLFQYRVLCFGLANAPSSFMASMHRDFKDCQAFTVIYMDDILIFSKNIAEHAQHVDKVLQLMKSLL